MVEASELEEFNDVRRKCLIENGIKDCFNIYNMELQESPKAKKTKK